MKDYLFDAILRMRPAAYSWATAEPRNKNLTAAGKQPDSTMLPWFSAVRLDCAEVEHCHFFMRQSRRVS